MKSILFFITIILAFGVTSNAQSVSREVLSSGGESTGTSSLMVNYTIGEAFVQSTSTSQLTITEGFQQGYAAKSDTGEGETGIAEKIASLTLGAFPNPTGDALTVTVEGNDQPLTMHCKNALGQVLHRSTLDVNGTSSVMVSPWSAGIYLIEVYNQEGSLVDALKFQKL